MKIVINKCFGGFGLSDAAYEHLAAQGIPVVAYKEETRDPYTGRFTRNPSNEGEVIFDRTLTPAGDFCDAEYIRLMGRYWDTWLRNDKRNDPRLVATVEALGTKANGRHAKLAVIEIPDDVDWEIDEYDGIETIHEKHRSWE